MADFGILTSYLFEAVHSLRMELGFVISFLLLWGASTLFERPKVRDGKALGATKKSSGGAVDATRSGGTRAPSRSACTRAPRSITEPFHDSGPATAEQLCDGRWVLAAVQQASRTQAAKAIALYREAIQAGFDVRNEAEATRAQLFSTLVTSALRAGLVDEAWALLRDGRKAHGLSAALLASCIKLCSARQQFKESLAMYDFFCEASEVAVDDPSVWSCLLFGAVETRSFRRCAGFYAKLCASGRPSGKDCSNMLRCAFTEGNWQLALKTVAEMRQASVEVDSVAYNTALATCVAASRTEEARALLEVMESTAGLADVVTYNTLAKGYAKAGRLEDCFELIKHMRDKGISPSQVTYGILLDCCINEKHMEKAAEVFNEMVSEGLVMNTVLYTTLIKGFARAEQVDQAMKAYRQMCSSQERSSPPDLITFSILIKANCDAGRLEDALVLLKTMKDSGLSPDEVVFNNLLGGCIREDKPELARYLYNTMIESGVKPSNATFSIFIRLYAQSKLLDDAMEMLRTEPKLQNVEAEPRLYVQLAQACLRERQGRRAVEAYKLMQEHSVPTAAVHGSLLGMCSKLNMLDTAVEILELAVENRSRLSAADVVQLRDIAARKRKTVCLEAIDKCMARLGVDPAGA